MVLLQKNILRSQLVTRLSAPGEHRNCPEIVLEAHEIADVLNEEEVRRDFEAAPAMGVDAKARHVVMHRASWRCRSSRTRR